MTFITKNEIFSLKNTRWKRNSTYNMLVKNQMKK